MKRLLGCVVLLLLSSLISACGDETGPTAPAAVAINLSGAWTGRMTYFLDPEGGVSVCASEPISLVMSHEDARFAARFTTSCEGALDLSGTLGGNVITGTLLRGSQSAGRVTGLVVSASRIEMTTMRRVAGRTVESEAVNRIELSR